MSEALHAAGCRVVVADIDGDAAQAVAASLAAALACRVDVADANSVDALRATVLEHFGAVDVLCNNAGVAVAGPVLSNSAADWRRVVDVNLLGTVHGVLAFAPSMVARGEGHIVNTASMAGFVAGTDLASYDATKHAIVAFSENLWRELQPSGVAVSVLCPAYVDTSLFRHATGPQASVAALRKATANNGIAPEDVAAKVVDALTDRRFWIFTHDDMVGMTAIKSDYARAGLAPADPFRSPSA